MDQRLKPVLGALATLGLTVALTSVAAAPAEAAAPKCEGKKATIVGTMKNDTLIGTKGPDVIVALAGDDTIRGRGGNDVICAGAGADTLYGGPGSDRLHGGKDKHGYDRAGTFQIGDTLRGGAGPDVLDAGFDDPTETDMLFRRDLIDYRESARGVVANLMTRVVTGQGRDTFVASTNIGIVGSAHDDVLRGTEGSDFLVGLAGNDRILGGAGPDELYADDAFYPGKAHDRDVVHAGPGDDLLDSNLGRDVLFGDGGDDIFNAHSPRATAIHGGDGDDSATTYAVKEPGMVMDPGSGTNDVSVGTKLPDAQRPGTTLFVDAGAGTIRLGDGPVGSFGAWQDVTFVSGTKVSYRGTDQAEAVTILEGRPLRAWTFGGDDDIFASNGDDYLDAGDGNDRIRANGGRDTCLNAERQSGCEE